jgi:hypothetical protein
VPFARTRDNTFPVIGPVAAGPFHTIHGALPRLSTTDEDQIIRPKAREQKPSGAQNRLADFLARNRLLWGASTNRGFGPNRRISWQAKFDSEESGISGFLLQACLDNPD